MLAERTTKRRMNLTSIVLFVPCLLLVSGNAVFAEPYLMLDASPAIYLSAPEESIFATELEFTLYALVNSEAPESDLTETFYLSAALVPNPGESDPGPDLGSYDFGGVEFDVVGTMIYGIPPIGLISNPGLLPPHGVYETYYREHAFTLETATRADLYNSMVTRGGPTDNPDGTLYYQAFEVDASGLNSGYVLHFDLYTLGSPIIDDFAPFSHDLTHTPVPASVILGMLGLGVAGWKLRKYA